MTRAEAAESPLQEVLSRSLKARKVPFAPSRQRPRRIGRAFEEFHKLLSSGKLEGLAVNRDRSLLVACTEIDTR